MLSIGKYFYTFLILILVFHWSGANIFFDRYVPFFMGLLLILLNLKATSKGSNRVWLLITVYIFINIFSFLHFKVEIPVFRILINMVNLFILPYLLLKKLGMGFWKQFEKIIPI